MKGCLSPKGDKWYESMDFYQTFLLKMLGDKVNARLPENEKIKTDDVNAVMSKINILAEKVDKCEFGTPTGESFSYLPKEVKVSLMKLISLTSALTSSVEWLYATENGYVTEPHNKDARRVLRATAALYYDRNDTRPVATYQKIYELDRIFTDDVTYETSTIEQRSNAEGLVRGIAETRCLSKFGIGEWFGSENDPEKMLSDIDAGNQPIAQVIAPPPVVEEAAVQENNSIMDNPVEIKETAQGEIPFEAAISSALPLSITIPQETLIKEDESSAPKKRTRKTKTEVTGNTVSEVAEPQTVATANLTLSLEEARKIKATIGLAASKGYTLGDIADDERMKVTNLKYIYAHSHNAKEKEGIKVLALSDDAIMQSFEREGISLS